MQRITYEANRS